MIYEIPCVPDGQALWTQRTALDGRDYLLSFQWQQRDGHWLVTVADQDGSEIMSGRAITTGYPVLRGCTDPRRPPGMLVALDTQGQGADADFVTLGTRVVLAYFDAAEMAA